MIDSPQAVTTMEHPLFSVIIATYNYGHLIDRALDSLLAQTFRSFETIVIDDGSTDDTPARMARRRDQMRFIRKENGGQSSAYNKGIEVAKGRFVVILDADDELLPDGLEKLGVAIERDGAAADTRIYYGGYQSVGLDGSVRNRHATPCPAAAEPRLRSFVERRLTGLQHGSTATPLAICREYRYPEQLRANTDIVFFGQVLANHPACCIDALISRIHAHPDRSRLQLDKILAAGLKPVDTLFNPAIIPSTLMPLRSIYAARRHRSLARMLYTNGRFAEARSHYWRAFKLQPSSLLESGSLKKALFSIIKSGLASGVRPPPL